MKFHVKSNIFQQLCLEVINSCRCGAFWRAREIFMNSPWIVFFDLHRDNDKWMNIQKLLKNWGYQKKNYSTKPNLMYKSIYKAKLIFQKPKMKTKLEIIHEKYNSIYLLSTSQVLFVQVLLPFFLEKFQW